MNQPTMTSRPRFDYEDFVRGFRAACARRGINPQEGATSFEVVQYLIERGEAARLARRRKGWWRRHGLWLECQPHHSSVEEAAIWRLFIDAYAGELERMMQAQRRREAAMALGERLPLRARHKQQRERQGDEQTQEL